MKRLYEALKTKNGNVVVGIGWVKRDDWTDPDEEGRVNTNITYYNMRLYDVYHAFWHMHKRYHDEVKKARAGEPTHVDTHRGRSYTYQFGFEIDEDEE